MKKEVFIAIIFGFILGLIITIGIATAQRSLKNHNAVTQISPLPTGVAPTNEAHSLFINYPQPNSVVSRSPLIISGTTTQGSMVAVTSAANRSSGAADPQGNFAINLNTTTGANTINIVSYSPSGDVAEKSLTFVYINEKPPAATPTPTKGKAK